MLIQEHTLEAEWLEVTGRDKIDRDAFARFRTAVVAKNYCCEGCERIYSERIDLNSRDLCRFCR